MLVTLETLSLLGNPFFTTVRASDLGPSVSGRPFATWVLRKGVKTQVLGSEQVTALPSSDIPAQPSQEAEGNVHQGQDVQRSPLLSSLLSFASSIINPKRSGNVPAPQSSHQNGIAYVFVPSGAGRLMVRERRYFYAHEGLIRGAGYKTDEVQQDGAFENVAASAMVGNPTAQALLGIVHGISKGSVVGESRASAGEGNEKSKEGSSHQNWDDLVRSMREELKK
ncbi:hypothetical protein HK102_012436 [Quaeritorhiza haematococci]|nr:hypothetical protein HK102_012436 [Quaeritorhiza haematococci]